MRRIPATTKWDPLFDSEPTSATPRMVFALRFSQNYIDKSKYVLDIGCGTGSYTKLIDRVGTIGVDLDIGAVKIAKKFCPNAEFIVCSALQLPFRAETLDLISLWEVFEEIAVGSETSLITELRRVLTRNSTFFLSTSYDHIISKFLDPAYIFKGVRHYGKNNLVNLITGLGFEINQCTTRGGVYTLASNFLVFFYKHILHKKEGRIKKFFDDRCKYELFIKNRGIVFLFISAQKK